MDISIVFVVIVFVVGGGLGYVVGWNRAAHPGKVEAQMQAVVDAVKALEKKITDKL